MRPYEVMVIYDPNLEEDAIRAAVDRSTELVRSRGGNPGRVDRWGKRRLAYEIRHQREGYYVLMDASAEPAVMAELDRALTLADEVLRHKVIRVPDRVAGRPARSASRSGPEPGSPAPFVADEATESNPRPNGA
ncbi:MAG: 30S ribosomal protein S6 [Acidimicrobiales bacterium]